MFKVNEKFHHEKQFHLTPWEKGSEKESFIYTKSLSAI